MRSAHHCGLAAACAYVVASPQSWQHTQQARQVGLLHQGSGLVQIHAQLGGVGHGSVIGQVVAAHHGAQILQQRALVLGDFGLPVKRAEGNPQARATAAALAGVSIRSPTSIFDNKPTDTPARRANTT